MLTDLHTYMHLPLNTLSDVKIQYHWLGAMAKKYTFKIHPLSNLFEYCSRNFELQNLCVFQSSCNKSALSKKLRWSRGMVEIDHLLIICFPSVQLLICLSATGAGLKGIRASNSDYHHHHHHYQVLELETKSAWNWMNIRNRSISYTDLDIFISLTEFQLKTLLGS